MGVSGSGKSLIGSRIAEALGLAFRDADDFHTPDNIRKMTAGIPLNDNDRAGWLQELSRLLKEQSELVLACSALKADYRQRLRDAAPDVTFLYLHGDFDTIWTRLSQREDHYFHGRDMLRNQFEQLEAPDPNEAIAVSIDQSVDAVVQDCLHALKGIHKAQ